MDETFADIRIATDRATLERAFPVMKELRPHIDMEAFLSACGEVGTEGGYRVAVVDRGGSIVAVMGYRVLTDLAHGRHVYIDDLVTAKDHRSAGHGARLLRFAEVEARRLDCVGLRLCAGVENEAGRRFYEREGWALRSVAYKKRLARLRRPGAP